MKKLSKIKLNQFSKNELDRRKLNALKGGCDCGTVCGCSCSSSPFGSGTSVYSSQRPDGNINNYVHNY